MKTLGAEGGMGEGHGRHLSRRAEDWLSAAY